MNLDFRLLSDAHLMTKQIGIDQLRPGMRIEKMDRSWLATPFLRHRMAITSMQQVEQLRACGVQTLEVTADDIEVMEPTLLEIPNPVQDMPPSLNRQGSQTCVTAPTIPFDEELPAAKQVYNAAKHIVEGAMHDVRLGRAIKMDAVHEVVSKMSDSVLRNSDALTSLSRLKRFDEYTFFHSVNTSLLAMSLGRTLGFDPIALHQIGVGTLLHDIGKTKIPLEILNKPGRFEA